MHNRREPTHAFQLDVNLIEVNRSPGLNKSDILKDHMGQISSVMSADAVAKDYNQMALEQDFTWETGLPDVCLSQGCFDCVEPECGLCQQCLSKGEKVISSQELMAPK